MHTQDDHPLPGWYCTPEEYSNALRTVRMHGTTQIHAWFEHLESEVIDLLPEHLQDQIRSLT